MSAVMIPGPNPFDQQPDDFSASEILPEQFTIRPATAAEIARMQETVLDEATRITAGDRQRYYGHPADNHGNTAELWSDYMLRRFGPGAPNLDARDVCLMMILLKVSRDANARKRDNLVDICGYARNAEQVEEPR